MEAVALSSDLSNSSRALNLGTILLFKPNKRIPGEVQINVARSVPEIPKD